MSIVIGAIIVLLILGVGAYAATGGFSGSSTASPTPAVSPTPAPTATAVPTVTPVPGKSLSTATPTATPTAVPTQVPTAASASNYSWPGYDFQWTPPGPSHAAVNPLLITSCNGFYNSIESRDIALGITMYVRLTPGTAPMSAGDVNVEVRFVNNTILSPGLCSLFMDEADGDTITDSKDVRLRIKLSFWGDFDYNDIGDVGITCTAGSEIVGTYAIPVWAEIS